MRNPLPALSHAQRVARADEKQRNILSFLADFEVFSTPANAAQLLHVSVVNARRTLSKLEKQGFLKKENHFIEGRQCDIYGITQSGLVAVAGDPTAPIFELGRLKSEYLRHKLECQRIRLICEGLGGSFAAERKLRTAGLKKIPDGLWYSYCHGRVAIEVEREAKTLKRMAEVFARHLVQMEGDEAYDMCLYLVPDRMRRGMLRLLQSVQLPEAPNRGNMRHKRLYRFAIASLEQFPIGLDIFAPEYLHIDAPLRFINISELE